MKTAVSLPDGLFDQGERLRHRLKKTRSEFYAAALREYLTHHGPGSITLALNAVVDETDEAADPFVPAAARRLLEGVEWEP